MELLRVPGLSRSLSAVVFCDVRSVQQLYGVTSGAVVNIICDQKFERFPRPFSLKLGLQVLRHFFLSVLLTGEFVGCMYILKMANIF